MTPPFCEVVACISPLVVVRRPAVTSSFASVGVTAAVRALFGVVVATLVAVRSSFIAVGEGAVVSKAAVCRLASDFISDGLEKV